MQAYSNNFIQLFFLLTFVGNVTFDSFVSTDSFDSHTVDICGLLIFSFIGEPVFFYHIANDTTVTAFHQGQLARVATSKNYREDPRKGGSSFHTSRQSQSNALCSNHTHTHTISSSLLEPCISFGICIGFVMCLEIFFTCISPFFPIL